MDFLGEIWLKAKKANKIIVLPETEDIRVLKAAEFVLKSKLAQIILIGNEVDIASLAAKNNVSLAGLTIIDPKTSPKLNTYVKAFAAKREKKGMTEQKAFEILSRDYPYFAGMMIALGDADGMVSGASHTTADTLRATIQCIGTEENTNIVSSFFAMISPKKEFGSDGLMFYADCGVIPNPSAEELAQIASQTANSFSKLTGLEPKVAMLSFSTKGSAKHPDSEKVIKATALAKALHPDILIDGELQADAALVLSIGKKKAPQSQVAGQANILIFPDLDAGNIGYKLTERLGGATALGPLLQGCKKAVNDLSRGCSVEDIINVTAITAAQAS